MYQDMHGIRHPRYPNVFKPIRLGPIHVPNRFYFAPHGIGLTVGSKPSADLCEYSAARVRDNGCGLVVVSLTVHERPRDFQASPYSKENIPAFRALADSVHAEGGKIFGEIGYHWISSGQWELFSPSAPILTPSSTYYSMGGRSSSTYAMSIEDIHAMVEAFRMCVRNLREAGFDGVMIHAAHAELIEQFLSPYFNKRTDEYGGSFENRLRLLVDILTAAKAEAGDKMAVGMRFNADEIIQGGYGAEGAREIIAAICMAGLVDYIDLDIALEPLQMQLGMPPMFIPPQVYRPYVEAVRGAAGSIPVLSVLGRLASIKDAEAALAAGVCDMVGAARALIAEPKLVSNAFAGEENLSRTCIACNWCLAALSEGTHGCAINPASYRERRWGDDKLVPASTRSKLVVVGGGPAGLEAARIASLRGHEVTLVEQRSILGGGLALWSGLPGREVMAQSIEWWKKEIVRLGVTVRLGEVADVATIAAEQADAVIIATGALYSLEGHSPALHQAIPGWDKGFVFRPEDVLLGTTIPTGRVVIYDAEGAHAGVGIAEVLAGKGCEVIFVTPAFSPVSSRLVNAQEMPFVMERLLRSGVEIVSSTSLEAIGDHQASLINVYSSQKRRIDEVNAVILATGRAPDRANGLAESLAGKVSQIFTIGDALGARSFAAAVYEGQKFARLVGEVDAPNTIGEAYFRANDADVWPIAADLLPIEIAPAWKSNTQCLDSQFSVDQ